MLLQVALYVVVKFTSKRKNCRELTEEWPSWEATPLDELRPRGTRSFHEVTHLSASKSSITLHFSRCFAIGGLFALLD